MIIGAFLSSSLVLADENTTISTTAENVQTEQVSSTTENNVADTSVFEVEQATELSSEQPLVEDSNNETTVSENNSSIASATTDTTDATVVANESALSDTSDNLGANTKAEEVSEDSQTAEVAETSTTITSAVDEEVTEDDNETETLKVNTDTVSEVNTASLTTSLVQATAKKVTSTQTQKSLVEASVSGNTLSIQYNGTITAGESLKFAAWSDNNDQDDLVWSDASFAGTALASYENHSGYETYHIHTYSFETGKAVGLNATDIVIEKSNVQTTITKVDDNTYKVTVINVPIYIKSVSLPVWSTVNGQDDIDWLTATKEDSSTYTGTISLKDHHYDSGDYNVYVYGQSKLGNQFIGLAVTKGFTVTETSATAPTITVSNYDKDSGVLTVTVSETSASKQLKFIRVVAWSESDQSNLYWYTTSDITNGTASLTVDEKYHDYIKGDYTVHVYVDFSDGTTSGYNLGSYTFNADQPVQQESSYFIDISSHNGVISVTEFLSLKSQGITGVVVKLTEGTSYTNPYASSQISNAQAAGLKVSAYHYSHYETAAEAKAEAQYFVSVAKSLGLSSSTVMVNDMESSEMLNGDINVSTRAWKEEMNRLGYGDLVYYTMASWLDIKGGKVSTSTFGMSNFWVAHYVYGYTYLDQETAKSLAYYSSAAAWQYTNVSPKLSHDLDENIDYTGRFTW
ncbi:GBS Bsp-like repeat-containing protein [Streptococcus macedonicus]|uniref:Lysozyme n=1 Tax=Streptococcus gallolyticus TaxID=315405 RepID=A0A380K9S4_9STRE|nr:GBS Bsp-like repeat-containing protein [Streptococcus macedonicus]WGK78488.1 GBS Bsp-like repeat-containing protein [Streptococcus macedonicus]SUN61802.1 N-acetylmuramoyl-L-alanine amidase [Streptococcus gallolyticus]